MKNQLLNKISIKAIEILPTVTLEEDVENINFINSVEAGFIEKTTYIVKIWLKEELPFSGISIDLYFNEYKVRKYFEFKGGIYFKVFNPRFFDKHSNKKIYFVIGNSEVIETEFKLPSFEEEFRNNIVPKDLQTVRTFKEVFK